MSCVDATDAERRGSDATNEMAVLLRRVLPDWRVAAAAGVSSPGRHRNGVRRGDHGRMVLDPLTFDDATGRLIANRWQLVIADGTAPSQNARRP